MKTSLKLYVNGISTDELKPKKEWHKLDNEESDANARVLFSIFNKVSHNEFCKIATCKDAKKA